MARVWNLCSLLFVHLLQQLVKMVRELSPELSKIALNELNEHPERLQDDLQHLKDWISKQPYLKARTGNFVLCWLFWYKQMISIKHQAISYKILDDIRIIMVLKVKHIISLAPCGKLVIIQSALKWFDYIVVDDCDSKQL